MNKENRTTADLQHEMDALKADLGIIQKDLQGVAQSALNMGKDSARHAREMASEKMDTGAEMISEYIHKRPVQTLAIAFVAGLVAGKLFGRG